MRSGRDRGRQPDKTETREAILDIAERLVQNHGFNGFSYGDVSTELGITTAALHYHFHGKASSAKPFARYAARFGGALASIDARDEPASSKLQDYADLYLSVLRDERMCLCGMLTASTGLFRLACRGPLSGSSTTTMPGWGVYSRQAALRSLEFTGSAEAAAQMIVSTLEGAMLVARPYNDAARFEAAASLLMSGSPKWETCSPTMSFSLQTGR